MGTVLPLGEKRLILAIQAVMRHATRKMHDWIGALRAASPYSQRWHGYAIRWMRAKVWIASVYW